VAQAVEILPSKHKALNSNPSTTGKKKRKKKTKFLGAAGRQWLMSVI
jgi:hypothetical protein